MNSDPRLPVLHSKRFEERISGLTSSPLPPLPEQHRIVAEIEKHFTRLDASVAALKRAQANLKRYRASLLKAACEGRLVPTEAELARSEDRDYELAHRLLERILAERRAHWESQPKHRGKYKEPVPPDTSDLPELPKGWVWASLSHIADLKGGLTKGHQYRKDQVLRTIPYLRVANVQRGYLDLRRLSTIETTEETIDLLRLIPGDVLFTEGGDRDKLGRGWVWKGEVDECIHQNHVFRSRLLQNTVIPEIVSWWGNSFGQDFFTRVGKQTTNLASINLNVLSQFPHPPPTSCRTTPHRGRSRTPDVRHPAGRVSRGRQPQAGRPTPPEHPKAGLLRSARAPRPQRRTRLRPAGAHPRRTRGVSSQTQTQAPRTTEDPCLTPPPAMTFAPSPSPLPLLSFSQLRSSQPNLPRREARHMTICTPNPIGAHPARPDLGMAHIRSYDSVITIAQISQKLATKIFVVDTTSLQ